jgi:hypothetical protein
VFPMAIFSSIHYEPLADVGGPLLTFFVGGIAALAVFIPIVIIEAVVLWLMKWDTFWRSLRTALIMNTISGFVGVVLYYRILDRAPEIKDFLLAFILTILIEGVVLWVDKKKSVLYLIEIVIIANLISYIGLFLVYEKTNPRLPVIPKTEIIYLVESDRKTLGFINGDGSSRQFMDLGILISKPFWQGDGKVLFLLENTKMSVDDGQLLTWEEGKRKHLCSNATWWAINKLIGLYSNTKPEKLMINNQGSQLLLIDPEGCVEVQVIVDASEDTSITLIGGSLSSDQRYLIYTQAKNQFSGENAEYSMIRRDLITGAILDLGHGLNPNWSPDGKEIAYLDLDGIYVMSSDGSNKKHIVSYDLREDERGNQFGYLLPEPQWSSDNDWLIYHLWLQTSKGYSKADIFKVDVNTGIVMKVVENGLFPYWRR